MHSPRTILLQTLGHFVLGHDAPQDFADFLRQRVEANYFAAAVLVPERSAARFLPEAKEARDLSVEDLRDVFSVSYEMAAHRFTNLATHHLGLTCHFVKNDESGIIYKAYENDGLVLPADATGRDRGAADVPQVVRPPGVRLGRPVLPVLPVLRHAGRDVLVRGPRRPGRASAGSPSPWACRTSTRGGSAAGRPAPADAVAAARTATAASARPASAGRPLGGHGLAVGPGAFAHPVRAADRELPRRGRGRRVRVPGPARQRVNHFRSSCARAVTAVLLFSNIRRDGPDPRGAA